ncbi:hypothetical protein [Streptomyces chiangmaiensis]|uniref:Uncharacterized protein n=1 Tax=Streptomyces chiangmaiensis TaxID=766497 RepID=A0ABU7FVB9_9ACTN|nr:hypothetical protein [Streptomyces chiangmaiensis]MED7827830.1 hypothetical protein [Streptomyces chiangmaiensis]
MSCPQQVRPSRTPGRSSRDRLEVGRHHRGCHTDPDVADLGRLAEAALHSAESGADISGACEALRALGAAALSTHQRIRVAELAEGDRRIVGSGVANSIIREDERLRAILTAI